MTYRTTKLQGFTLVELLIVIVVIGILAAITLVAYNGIQQKANNAAVASDASNIVKKLYIFNIDNGHYPASMADLNSIADMKLSVGSYGPSSMNNVYYDYDATNNMYAFGLRSSATQGYMIVNGQVSIVGNGGDAHIGASYVSAALTAAGGTFTYGTNFYVANTGWVAGFNWAT